MTRIYGSGAQDLAQAADVLAHGGILAVPTETVYGLAAHALDEKACRRIFEIKGRPLIDPLIVHIHDLAGANRLAHWNEWADSLAKAFWPGPLTLVLPKKEVVPPLVTAGLETVAVRMPRHPLLRKLLIKCNLPLAAPSANPFGYLSPTRPEHVLKSFGQKLEHLLNGGPCQIGLESTVVDLSQPHRPAVLRPGPVGPEDISEILGIEVLVETESRMAATTDEKVHSDTRGKPSPGLLHKHYSPGTPLVVLPCQDWTSQESPTKRIAKIAYRKPDQAELSRSSDMFWLTEDGDEQQAAHGLYDLLHKLDSLKFDLILIEPAPEGGLGTVINERLSRATSLKPDTIG